MDTPEDTGGLEKCIGGIKSNVIYGVGAVCPLEDIFGGLGLGLGQKLPIPCILGLRLGLVPIVVVGSYSLGAGDVPTTQNSSPRPFSCFKTFAPKKDIGAGGHGGAWSGAGSSLGRGQVWATPSCGDVLYRKMPPRRRKRMGAFLPIEKNFSLTILVKSRTWIGFSAV